MEKAARRRLPPRAAAAAAAASVKAFEAAQARQACLGRPALRQAAWSVDLTCRPALVAAVVVGLAAVAVQPTTARVKGAAAVSTAAPTAEEQPGQPRPVPWSAARAKPSSSCCSRLRLLLRQRAASPPRGETVSAASQARRAQVLPLRALLLLRPEAGRSLPRRPRGRVLSGAATAPALAGLAAARRLLARAPTTALSTTTSHSRRPPRLFSLLPVVLAPLELSLLRLRPRPCQPRCRPRCCEVSPGPACWPARLCSLTPLHPQEGARSSTK